MVPLRLDVVRPPYTVHLLQPLRPENGRIIAREVQRLTDAIRRSPHLAFLNAVLVGLVVFTASPLFAQEPVLRWGGDAEGGAPFVEADAADTTKLVGFDVDIATLIARELGRRPQFVQVAFASLDQSAARGDFDIGLSGIEDTPGRRGSLAVSLPYYRFQEVLTVREADRDRFRTLADLRGRRVATLGGTIAYEILLTAEQEHGIIAVSYDDDVHPYTDTVIGRVDAVLLDNVLADRAMRRNAGLHTQPTAVTDGHYVIVTAGHNTGLRDEVDRILRGAMSDGRL